MSKILIRSVFLTLIIGLVLIILFYNRSPFGGSNSSFSSKPQKEITKIEFSAQNRKLSLEKVKGNWFVNGKSEARKSGILFVIRILEEIKIKSPVSDELFKKDIAEKNVEPVKVKVYENRKLLKSFIVYKTSSNIYGNIMKVRYASKPFIVYVPGFEGDIGSGFNLNELFWQPYTVFNLLPSEIGSVDFENNNDTTASFTITSKDHHFCLSDRRNNISGWDSTLIARYLSYFTRIPFESWALDLGVKEKEQVKSQKPLYRITVNTSSGNKIVLMLWERNKGGYGEKTKDSDRLYGKTLGNDELFVIRYFDIDPLLKKRAYFFQK